MGAGFHGGFGNTYGNNNSLVGSIPNKELQKSSSHIKSASKNKIKDWAEKKRAELTGKAKKNFNTACVVYDETTGKYYYGRNGGYKEKGYVKNPALFGDAKHQGLLPKTSLNKYPIGNCAEVDAINKALNDGANISNLHMSTIHTTKHQFGNYKESCENCKYAFFGKIKANYSGWKGE